MTTDPAVWLIIIFLVALGSGDIPVPYKVAVTFTPPESLLRDPEVKVAVTLPVLSVTP